MMHISGFRFENLGNSSYGKFADSHDQFVFYYQTVDPRKENFCLSALIEVEDASGVDFQTGYGIMLADTIANPSQLSRHRNHALLGRFRAMDGRNYCLGLRIVGGYTHPLALPQRRHRLLDPSRLFALQPKEDAIKKGDWHRLTLAKTDAGLEASCETENGIETILFPGCDFLLKQDKNAAYAGFAIAGQVKVRITDVQFERSPGKLSHTPQRTIGSYLPDYPFCRTAFSEPSSQRKTCGETIRLSPGQDLASAILSAGPGCEIVLADGCYESGPYYIPESNSGERHKAIILRAEHRGKAVIDCSGKQAKLPAMTLRASYWKLDGLVFRGAHSAGLFVCGSHNRILNCEAVANGDTGLLLCSYPGSTRKDWPGHNRVEFCVSHDNCDAVRRNADGFGAKLSVGRRNFFLSCKAFHNIDDGFDLYTKDMRACGPIGPVRIIDCEAYCNGWLSSEKISAASARNGSGFKLGGENLQVRHHLIRCTAHDNAGAGFNGNTNRSFHLWKCREWDNNKINGFSK